MLSPIKYWPFVAASLAIGLVYFIYTELQEKAVLESELQQMKDSQQLETKVDRVLESQLAEQRKSTQTITARVRHEADTSTNGRLSDEFVRGVMCANGLLIETACSDSRTIP
ncbi:hypothetical protein [Neptunomonas marina]|uniref:Uncharacterized protein n=1 Tax=Neptunomonas marina TaxID=1815562 RepID=A0A437QDS4_9GAMM|nr:hypothetical protein [Neptunomonas marina]RVU32708.1 hypothetical protein EOE65_03370 [Neptunomonas marina]